MTTREAQTLATDAAATASDLADAAIARELAGHITEARALWAGARAYALTAHAANMAALGIR